jgi:hypothetical protein
MIYKITFIKYDKTIEEIFVKAINIYEAWYDGRTAISNLTNLTKETYEITEITKIVDSLPNLKEITFCNNWAWHDPNPL